jgi:protein-S-isoprenylcysteine O-methyltransferase Ste14
LLGSLPNEERRMNVRRPLLPPTYFQISLVLQIALHFLFPLQTLFRFPWTLLGLLPLGLGIGLNLWADGLFKKAQTTVKPFQSPSALVADGPFRYTRHPMYFGMVKILGGVWLLCGTLSPLAGAIFFWLVVHFHFIPAEEQSMRSTFPEYTSYARRVRSWV